MEALLAQEQDRVAQTYTYFPYRDFDGSEQIILTAGHDHFTRVMLLVPAK